MALKKHLEVHQCDSNSLVRANCEANVIPTVWFSSKFHCQVDTTATTGRKLQVHEKTGRSLSQCGRVIFLYFLESCN